MNRILRRLLLFTLAISACFTAHGTGSSHFLRADYYVWKRFENKGGPNAEQIKNIEVLIFFSPLIPEADGTLTIDKAFEDALSNLKKAKSPQTKIWLGLGDLRPVCDNPQAIRALADNLLHVCKKYGFTGVDIDWEGNEDIDARKYADVVKAISRKCRPARLAIANSVGTGNHYIAKSAAAEQHLDFVNIQFYYSKINAQPLSEFAKVLTLFENSGIPRRKILVGLPLYGMVDMKKDRKTHPVTIGYGEMISKGARDTKNSWTDPDSNITYYYSGKPLLFEKLNYAKKNGFGGVFTWELTMDAPYSSRESLLRMIDKECKR